MRYGVKLVFPDEVPRHAPGIARERAEAGVKAADEEDAVHAACARSCSVRPRHPAH
jgi:hypothetical protein